MTFDEISPALLDALTAVEDKTFWTNTGFDPVGIGAAAIDTLQGDGRGASTITQQLVRQRLLDPALVQDPDRTVERKIKEIIQSIRVTQAFPGLDGKRRIITAYYNQNFFGNNNYGIRAAAKDYFGVSDLNELTLAQAAILAAIPQSPSSYDLMRNAEEQEDGTLVVPATSRVVQRRNTVLDLMEQGRTPISTERGTSYTAADFDAARASPVVLAPRVVPIWKAPHFVWAVREQLTEVLCDPGAATCPTLERGGLKIVTTLDWKLQQLGERWVKAAAILPQVKDPKAYAKQIGVAYRPWMAKLRNKKIYNGALVAMDWQTGEVVTYVGSADYYAPKATKKFQPQFDVLADGWRQPGSAYKPFDYVTGIDDGSITAATMLMDVATNFARSGKAYIPTNADNLERGPVRVRSALQFSLNIPAIKALSYIGIDRVFATSRKLGLRYLGDESQAGLSLAIGSEEVHPIDMATGYSSIANGGRYIGRTTILTIQDATGKNVISPYKPPAGDKAVSPQAAYIVTDILSGNTNPRINPVWGKFTIKNKSGERRPATLKTGTNNDAKDLNAYGFIAAPSKEGRAKGEYALTVGAWNGNSDNTVVSTPGNPVFSIDVTTYVWQGFMQAASRNWEIRDFRRPKGLKEATVDAFTGLKPGPFKSKTVREMFIDGTQPTQVDRTKVGMQIEKETGTRWQEGCVGTPVTRGFLDLSGVESGYPAWQRQNREVDRPRQEGRRCRRRPRPLADILLLQSRQLPPIRSYLGGTVPAQEDVHHRRRAGSRAPTRAVIRRPTRATAIRRRLRSPGATPGRGSSSRARLLTSEGRDARPISALPSLAWAPILDQRVIAEDRPHGIAHGAGTVAVDDREPGGAGHAGAVDVAIQRLERLIDAGAAQVERGGDAGSTADSWSGWTVVLRARTG